MPVNVLALGEVLWDVFPDGPRFGGAPANFACSVKSLGRGDVTVSLASAVGDDDLGRAALAELQKRGVDTTCVTVSPRPTGTVTVTLDAAGVPSYRFADEPAWGDLEWTDALAAKVAAADVVYFGTLAQSRQPARATIRRALADAPPGSLRLLDLNLRTPFWDADTIRDSAKLATVLKVNEEEVGHVARLPFTTLAATRGAAGSVIITRKSRSQLRGKPVKVVDTVGAGDAFAAALAIGLATKLPLGETHRWAAAVAAFACTVAGGTPDFPEALKRPAC